MSGTVDGLNFFGRRLADTTPTFSDPPADPEATPDPVTAVASASTKPAISKSNKKDTRPPVRSKTQTSVASPKPQAPSTQPARSSAPPLPINLKIATNDAAPAKPPCVRSGYALVLEPPAEPVGAALARSLTSSDLQAHPVELRNESFRREDAERVLAGETPLGFGQIRESTLLIAQLKTRERRTIIDDAPMIELAGTIDLAIVRNNCGTIAVQRHYAVYGRSVNETWEDGVRGLGEVFKERIMDLVKR